MAARNLIIPVAFILPVVLSIVECFWKSMLLLLRAIGDVQMSVLVIVFSL